MITIFRSTDGVLERIQDMADGSWVRLLNPGVDELSQVAQHFGIPTDFLTSPLDLDETARRLYVVCRENYSLYVLDLDSKALVKRLKLPAMPYTCLLSRDGKRLYVSLWGGSAVAVVGTGRYDIRATVPVGDHPCDMVETADGSRLFVANANNNTVYAVDIAGQRVQEMLTTSLRPDAPAGSTPNAVALSPDGKTLFIANADNNYLALFDVEHPGTSRPLGFIPTGWYPSAVRALTDGRCAVANGKGLASGKPAGSQSGDARIGAGVHRRAVRRHHELDLGLAQAAGGGDGDFLLPAGGFILRVDVQNAVGVDVEGDLDLRHAARRGRETVINTAEAETEQLTDRAGSKRPQR